MFHSQDSDDVTGSFDFLAPCLNAPVWSLRLETHSRWKDASQLPDKLPAISSHLGPLSIFTLNI